MSNFIYKKAKEGILNGLFSFNEKNFKVLFTNENYTANENLDQFVSDITPSAIVYRSNNLSNVTNINGVIDAEDLTFTISANVGFNSLVLYQIGNSDQESRLLAYVDTAIGLPYAGSAEPVSSSIVWSNLPGKILSI
jgi:hypothetical protein